MKRFLKVNINDHVRVRVTPLGMDVREKFYREIGVTPPPLKADEEGRSLFQIWEFANIFGDSLHLGGRLTVEATMEIEVQE